MPVLGLRSPNAVTTKSALRSNWNLGDYRLSLTATGMSTKVHSR